MTSAIYASAQRYSFRTHFASAVSSMATCRLISARWSSAVASCLATSAEMSSGCSNSRTTASAATEPRQMISQSWGVRSELQQSRPAAIRRCVRHCTAATPTTEAPAAKTNTHVSGSVSPARDCAQADAGPPQRSRRRRWRERGFQSIRRRSTDARRHTQPSVFAEERAPDVRLIGQNLIDAGLIPDARCAAL